MRKKFFIVLTIVWMGVIFYMSNQSASISSMHSGNTINIISKLPLIGNIMDYLTSINIGEFIVRKCAHMTSYCILAILLFMSVYENDIKKTVIISFLGTFLYACSDEFHQLFIYGRSGEFRDVMIDSTGGIVGLLLIIFIVKYKQINKKIEK
ncbi:VanZ family protein [Romboutsia ilealis]|uniref:VanZ family protein n=1 Tax=Romboutsia ilealis TaxID=1115758 RepID=UPI00259D2112|nr:VanZ family protein [Romboutsia ilealis]